MKKIQSISLVKSQSTIYIESKGTKLIFHIYSFRKLLYTYIDSSYA